MHDIHESTVLPKSQALLAIFYIGSDFPFWDLLWNKQYIFDWLCFLFSSRNIFQETPASFSW